MMSRATGHLQVEHDPARRQEQSLGFLVGVALSFFMALGWAGRALHNEAGSGVLCPPERINPNDAPLASLMRLPGVGLTRARAIVEYRSGPAGPTPQQPVFADGDDMQQVKGLGPATVEDILPWLQFPTAPAEYYRSSDTD